MDEITIELNIYSPRWGHTDIYKVVFTRDNLNITTHGKRSTTATWHENRDPEWSGESLEDILRNDSIYPPAVLQSLIEHVWVSWHNGEIDDSTANNELQLIAEWLNKITELKPQSDFWRKYF